MQTNNFMWTPNYNFILHCNPSSFVPFLTRFFLQALFTTNNTLLYMSPQTLNNYLAKIQACYQPITPRKMYDEDGHLRTMASRRCLSRIIHSCRTVLSNNTLDPRGLCPLGSRVLLLRTARHSWFILYIKYIIYQCGQTCSLHSQSFDYLQTHQKHIMTDDTNTLGCNNFT